MIPADDPIPALLGFVERWVPGLSPNHRVDRSLIPTFVPPPLCAIYEIAGNWPVPYHQQWRPRQWNTGLFGTQDLLLPIDQLKIKGERFTFIHENQYVWTCETLMGRNDPPVFCDAGSVEAEGSEMVEVCSSLKHFLTTYCLQELAFGSKHLFCVDSEVRRPGDLIEGDLENLWLKGLYVWREPSHSFYLCNNRLLVMETCGAYWIAYNEDACSDLVKIEHKIRRIH